MNSLEAKMTIEFDSFSLLSHTECISFVTFQDNTANWKILKANFFVLLKNVTFIVACVSSQLFCVPFILK